MLLLYARDSSSGSSSSGVDWAATASAQAGHATTGHGAPRTATRASVPSSPVKRFIWLPPPAAIVMRKGCDGEGWQVPRSRFGFVSGKRGTPSPGLSGGARSFHGIFSDRKAFYHINL